VPRGTPSSKLYWFPGDTAHLFLNLFESPVLSLSRRSRIVVFGSVWTLDVAAVNLKRENRQEVFSHRVMESSPHL
jgi:hypothetical protein